MLGVVIRQHIAILVMFDLRATPVSADAERIVAVFIAWGVATSAIKGAVHSSSDKSAILAVLSMLRSPGGLICRIKMLAVRKDECLSRHREHLPLIG